MPPNATAKLLGRLQKLMPRDTRMTAQVSFSLFDNEPTRVGSLPWSVFYQLGDNVA